MSSAQVEASPIRSLTAEPQYRSNAGSSGFSLRRVRTNSLASGERCFSAIRATVSWPLQPQARGEGDNKIAEARSARVAKRMKLGLFRFDITSRRPTLMNRGWGTRHPADTMTGTPWRAPTKYNHVAMRMRRGCVDAGRSKSRPYELSQKARDVCVKKRTRGEGAQAPSQRPMGRQDSLWSQMTRRAAVIGMARSRPMPPHTQPQKSSAMVIATALRRTRRPTSAGAMKFEAITWIERRTPAISTNEPIVLTLALAMMNAGTQAITAPMYGTMLSKPEAMPVRIG